MLNKIFVPGEVQMKADGDDMSFTAYANVKNIVDKALDVAMDGCYKESIKRHKANGTAPALLWSHNPYGLPVGVIKEFEEDTKGLLFGGKLSATTMGKDLHVLAKDGAIKTFSIGYTVNQERWNNEKGVNELIEIDVKEVSWVNFPCNEESTLETIKSHTNKDQLPTERELERFLRSSGLSKSEARKIASHYNPALESKLDVEQLKGFNLFK